MFCIRIRYEDMKAIYCKEKERLEISRDDTNEKNSSSGFGHCAKRVFQRGRKTSEATVSENWLPSSSIQNTKLAPQNISDASL